jgi:hypothetical protein
MRLAKPHAAIGHWLLGLQDFGALKASGDRLCYALGTQSSFFVFFVLSCQI